MPDRESQERETELGAPEDLEVQEVETGGAGFSAILVSDVSRWGRFQDAVERAYYEGHLPEVPYRGLLLR